MGSAGLETIFIGGVAQSDWDSFGAGVAHRSGFQQGRIRFDQLSTFIFEQTTASGNDLGGFALLDSVSGGETEKNIKL